MNFSVKVDSKQVEHLFADLGRKLPKVMADTCNVLAGKVQVRTIEEMRSKFKGGTSQWVLNSFKVDKATASNPVAVVKYNRGRHFMAIQVDGGPRPAKAAETLLRSKGVIPNGLGYLPTRDSVQADGNMSPGVRSQILSYFKTYTGTHTEQTAERPRNHSQYRALAGFIQFPICCYQPVFFWCVMIIRDIF